MKEISDKVYEKEVIQSKKPVLIEFWASWCVPCKAMERLLNELENLFNSKLYIFKMNVDRNRRIPRILNLTGVPTFMSYSEGKEIQRRVGAQSKEALIEMINKII